MKKKEKNKNQLEEKLSKTSPEALDLIKKMLTIDTQSRITAKDAIEHPYLADFRDAKE